MWTRIALTGTLVLLLAVMLVKAQNGNDLYQQGLVKQAEADIPGAIEIFKGIVKDFQSNKKLAASATLQLGLCYEKMGQEMKAQDYFQQVIVKYADQPAVNEARKHLSAQSATESTAGIHMVDMDLGGGRARGPANRLTHNPATWDQGLSWSPDGKSIAFKRRSSANFPIGANSDRYDLVVRTLETGQEKTAARNLRGEAPLWFHDNSSLLEYEAVTRTFRRLDLGTGKFNNILTLDFVPLGIFTNDMAAMSLDGKVLYIVQEGGGTTSVARHDILVFDLTTGKRTKSFTLTSTSPIISRMVLSPDGLSLAFVRANDAVARVNPVSALVGINGTGVRVASVGVDGSKYRTIYDGAPIADLAWTRDGKGILLGALTTKDISSVIYVPADGGQPKLTGLEVTRLQGLNPAPEGRRVAFSGVSYRISNDQILPAVLANSINDGTQQLLQFTILDRGGHVVRTVGDPIARSGFISMSPDGARVGFNCQGGFCVLDLATGAKIQIGGTSARAPAWSFDGGRIIYLSNPTEGGTDVFVRASNGTGQEELLYRNPTDKLAIFHWSQDGRFVMMASQGGGGFWVLPVTGDRKLMSVLTTQFSKNGLRISPDSRFIAYLSNESGANQVWVQPFAPSSSEGPIPTDVRWQVSFQGSLGMIRWRADGKEMYYLAPDGGVMAVPITYDPQFKAGTPAPLFHVPPSFPMSGTPGTIADVSADGQQFVLLLPLSK